VELITAEELKEKLDRGDYFKLVMVLGERASRKLRNSLSYDSTLSWAVALESCASSAFLHGRTFAKGRNMGVRVHPCESPRRAEERFSEIECSGVSQGVTSGAPLASSNLGWR
jgi:hypothetical protein